MRRSERKKKETDRRAGGERENDEGNKVERKGNGKKEQDSWI